jgi:hypothetical protein
VDVEDGDRLISLGREMLPEKMKSAGKRKRSLTFWHPGNVGGPFGPYDAGLQGLGQIGPCDEQGYRVD